MNYVVGFLFSVSGTFVALIEKQKPEWQKGKLNGIGGKIEEGESQRAAMRREFEEETGAYVGDWRQFAILNHSGNTVYCFVATQTDQELKTMTGEKVDWYYVKDIDQQPVIGNLKWLIPLALDPDGLRVVIEDKTTPWEKSNANTSSVR